MNPKQEQEELLFDQARGLKSRDEQVAFLQQACNGDQELMNRLLAVAGCRTSSAA
ncbi:MAG: hypothetical protein WCH99_18610 [Verrucomicrobiota bacterium]